MIAITLILAVIAVTTLVVFGLVVISVHATDRRLSLRHPSHARIDAFARRVLGVYADRPGSGAHGENENALYHQARR